MTDRITAACDLRLPNLAHFEKYIRTNAKTVRGRPRMMLRAHTRQGQSVAIVGAGPSLNDHLDELHGREVWAVNSALPFLVSKGVRPTHAFTMDQTKAMLRDWAIVQSNVVYYVASSVMPVLVTHLTKGGARLRFYHSFTGLPDPKGWDKERSYEMDLYCTLFPSSVMAGHGLNSVPRAVCVALAMGYDDVAVYGADCACKPDGPRMPGPSENEASYLAWQREVTFYADGRPASDMFAGSPFAEGEIDGRRWHTRADMVISAQHLLELARDSRGRVRLIGDTLPNAIKDKPPEWMAQMPRLEEQGRVTNFERAVA